MIISASYKTDIPTFYGEWFMNRLHAGCCKMVNPYNQRVYRVPLDRPSVDGFVFWTKNIQPFLKHLPEIHQTGYPFVIQYTINDYPRALEQRVIDADRSVENLRHISATYGPKVSVWRYDTIILSSLTPVEFHLKNFARLAEKLAGATDEVVISFVHLYKKTLRNMDQAARISGFEWRDPTLAEKCDLAARLAEIAAKYRMQLTVCSQPEYLAQGAQEAHCVDIQRLAAVAGKPVRAALRGNRKGCGCFYSRDIGEYDTCPHGCVYCYAVRDHELAQARFRIHDPESEFLFPPPPGALDSDEPASKQLTLF